MLEIGLVPKASGSAGFGRFYPHQGYLGLSPVVVEGTILARLPPLYPSLPVRQVTITVRCVATRTIGSEVESVLWAKSKRLWEPSGSGEYEDIGDWSSPFKVAIPIEAAAEAASAQWTRDLKVVWQVQVAFDHKPIPYVGTRIVKTYLLDIRSYVTQPLPPPSPPTAMSIPGAQLCINPPHGSFGPGDPFTVSIHVKPDDPAACIRRTTLIIERRTRIIEPSSGCGETPERKGRRVSPLSGWRRSTSPQDYTKIDEDSAHTTKVLEVTTEEATLGSGGMYWVSLTGAIPKRGGKWEPGETGETKVTMTTFECKVKVSLKTKSKSCKEITCPAVPIVLTGSSITERTTAYAVVAVEAEAHPKASLPKRKHRSSRRGLYMQEGTTDISDPLAAPGSTRRRRSASPDMPALPIFTPSPPPGIKPILLPSNPTPQPQSISFAFPANRPALPITTLIHPPSPISTPALPDDSPTAPRDYFHPTFSPPSSIHYPDMSILRQYQSSGRRISTSTTEEEEIQPSRSRIRLDEIPAYNSFSALNASSMSQVAAHSDKDRPTLPSLDVLGLRLPPVPEYEKAPRRPRTAPVHSAFPSNSSAVSTSGLDGDGDNQSGESSFLSPNGRAMAANGNGMGGERPVTSGVGARFKAQMRDEGEGAFAFSVAKA